MVKLLLAVAAFLNVFIYLLYVFRAEPTTMHRQLTGVSKPRWGWIIPAYGSLSMSYRIPKGSRQRPINDERRLFTPQESKMQKKDDGIKRLVTRLIGNPQLSIMDFLRGVTISKWTRKIIYVLLCNFVFMFLGNYFLRLFCLILLQFC